MPRIHGDHQILGKEMKNLSPDALEEYGSGDTLISDIWPPEPERIHFYYFKLLNIWQFVTIALGN